MDKDNLKAIFDKLIDDNSNLTSGEIRMLLLDALDKLDVEE